jgi:hypothetical protein
MNPILNGSETARGRDGKRENQGRGNNMGRRKIDLMGKRFGRLLVIRENPERAEKSRAVQWQVKCDCGMEKLVTGAALVSGRTVSCGCLQKELAASALLKHGEGGHNQTRLYRIWAGMKNRCYFQGNKHYKSYGGRGIMVCSQWKDSFEAFRDWANLNGYRDDLSIDRKNPDGNYEPSNCQWVTDDDQRWNKRNTRKIQYHGKEYTVKEFSERFRIPHTVLYNQKNMGGYGEDKLEGLIKKYTAAVV